MQIFKDYNILTLCSLYIVAVTCFIKNYKDLMAKNFDIHNHNTQRKLNLHVQHCMTNMGISLYNKVPDQIKLRKKINSFKKDLKSVLLMNSCCINVYLCFYGKIWISFSLNLHNFRYTASFHNGIFACGIM
jgi:hypothetical protein